MKTVYKVFTIILLLGSVLSIFLRWEHEAIMCALSAIIMQNLVFHYKDK